MYNEKENVFRTLREENLLMTSWLCRFGWHKWQKYQHPEWVTQEFHKVLVQIRYCDSCNLRDSKTLATSY